VNINAANFMYSCQLLGANSPQTPTGALSLNPLGTPTPNTTSESRLHPQPESSGSATAGHCHVFTHLTSTVTVPLLISWLKSSHSHSNDARVAYLLNWLRLRP